MLVYDIDSQVFERIQSFLSRKKLIKIESKNIINQANQGFIPKRQGLIAKFVRLHIAKVSCYVAKFV